MIKKRIIKVFDWGLRIVSYTIVLMLMTLIFKNTLYIDNSFYGIWCLVASLLIYLLNKTIKPFLIWLTIPITGITLGLFYPFVNLIILKIVSLILGIPVMNAVSNHSVRFIIAGMLFLLTLMTYACGIILGVIAKKHKQEYEILMNLMKEEK